MPTEKHRKLGRTSQHRDAMLATSWQPDPHKRGQNHPGKARPPSLAEKLVTLQRAARCMTTARRGKDLARRMSWETLQESPRFQGCKAATRAIVKVGRAIPIPAHASSNGSITPSRPKPLQSKKRKNPRRREVRERGKNGKG